MLADLRIITFCDKSKAYFKVVNKVRVGTF